MNRKKIILDKEEKELLASVERGEWVPVPNLEQRKKEAREMAKRYFKKDAKVTVRLSSADVEMLKQRAAYEGLSYPTFLSSVLHKYAASHIGY